jgi:CubicO group peptidase (beta-lactamase class C family)
VIATMPLMFFVAGSLLHNSLEARPAGQVLRSRLRRLLVPFWFFGAIVLGFLALGLLIENVTGQDYETVLAERVLEPYGLSATSVDTTPRQGWIGDSAGGVSSTVNDLATWGAHLYRDGDVVSPGSLQEMTSIDDSLYAGLGTFPVCPCTPNGDGTVQPTSYGHNGGSVALQYSPADNVVIAVGFSESFWLGGFGQSDVYEFLAQVRAFANS